MAVFNEPTKWAQTLGKDADVVKIPDIAGDTDPSIDKIFPAVFSIPLAHGGKAIPRSVLNGLFKLLGDWSFYQQNGGVSTYSESFDYVAGRVVLYTDGNLYKCKKSCGASSTVVAPDSDTAYWQRLDNFVRSVNSVNADDNGNVSITSVNHATSADSATKAIQDKNGAQIDTTYFKSANGTFTGQEYSRDVNNSVLRFNGGNTYNGGAALMLYGKNAKNAQGVFDLAACTKDDASDAKQLIGTPAGSLTWNGKNIVRSVNSVNADDNGNVSITSVNHATSADSATKAIQDKNGAQIDTTYFKSANGTFTGQEYSRDVNNSVLRFNGGNTHDGGAGLMLFGKNAKNAQGVFDLAACTKDDGSDSKQLIGTPAGSLTWAGHEVERVKLKNGNYIRFTSGLTLMWGELEIPAGTKKYTVNLPIPFNSNYQAFLANLGSEDSSIATVGYRVTRISLSAFSIEHTFGGLTGWSYFAVGY